MKNKLVKKLAITGFIVGTCSMVAYKLNKDDNKKIEKEVFKNLILSEENGTMLYPFAIERKNNNKRKYIKLR